MSIKKTSVAFMVIIGLLFSCQTGQKVEQEKKIKEGPGEIFWKNGSLKGKGNYKNFQKNGKWTLYHKNSGEKLAEGEYRNDKQNGPWLFYHKNRVKSAEGNFTENQKTGRWKGYFNSSDVLWKAKYVIRNTDFGKVGGIEGTKTTFYRSGKVQKQEEYRKGLKKGRSQEFYEDGTPKEISWYTDNKHNGKCNTYWNNGNPKEQGFYTDDMRNGNWKFSYENGRIKMTGKFIIGKLKIKGEEKTVSQMTGKWQFFSPGGLLQKEGIFKNGKEKGLWKFYTYPTRRVKVLMMELSLRGGMANGIGKIYNNGKLDGSGEMMGTVKGIYEKYINKKKVGEENAMDVPPNNPAAKVTYKWSGKWIVPRLNGNYTGYYRGGKKKKFETKYMMGKMSGKYKEYFKNGKIKAEGEYMNGKKSGMWKVFNKNGSVNKSESGRWMMGKKSKI